MQPTKLKKEREMKTVGYTVLALCVLSGCANNGTMTTEQQLQIMREVEASRRAAAESFGKYRDTCAREFPLGTDLRDDGGAHLSAQGAVNVALANNGQEIVCSVSIVSSEIDRIWADGRTYTLADYRLADTSYKRRLALAEADAAQIQNGNHEVFVLSAKRVVSDAFKDPDSVRYRDMYISNKTVPTLCGELNSKNSYGGYVGYKRFFYNRVVSAVYSNDSSEEIRRYAKLEAIYCNDKFINLPQ